YRSIREAATELPFPIIETLPELVYGATLLHDTVHAFRWALFGDAEPSWKAPLWTHADPPKTHNAALAFACDVVNHALKNAAPRVVPLDENDVCEVTAIMRGELIRLPLIVYCFFQVALDLQEGSNWRLCPWDAKLFKRQRGRAVRGQHRRIGSVYCSDECQR